MQPPFRVLISDLSCVSTPVRRGQALGQWQSAMDRCKVVWKELQGVPLLPLANGTAGSFPTAFALAGRKRFVVGTRRQQGLLPKLTDRFVHLKATRRLARFFERDDFLEVSNSSSVCLLSTIKTSQVIRSCQAYSRK